MNKTQFEQLQTVSQKPRTISIKDLSERGERTLLYGYTCDKETFHVYIRAGELHKAIFTSDHHKPSVYEHGLELNLDGIVPNKRLYPEACDLEFCTLLTEAGVYLSFTTFDEKREKRKFYTNVVQPSGNLSAWESCK